MAPPSSSLPIGIKISHKLCSIFCRSVKALRVTEWNLTRRLTFYKVSVLLLTYAAYTAFHLSRRPLSVVKNVLNRNCSELTPPAGTIITNETRNTWCNWAPFDGPDANALLGLLDSAFLFSYAIFMFFSGYVAERCHLRYFLSIGMLLSGIFAYLFGIAYYYEIHSLYFFLAIQIVSGIVQTSGWPAVVTCMGQWFDDSKNRDIVFGLWNSHTSVGNILGAAIAGWFVTVNWGLSFIICGSIIGFIGFLIFLFLVPCKTSYKYFVIFKL